MSAGGGSGRGSIFIQNETLRRGFTSTPNRVLCDARLSMGARFVYTLLLSYAWQDDCCFPGQERLARDVGCSVRTVQRYLAELEEGGEIRVIQQGLQRPNIYVIVDRRADTTQMSRQEAPNMAGQDPSAMTPPRVTRVTPPEAPQMTDDKGRHSKRTHRDVDPSGGVVGPHPSAERAATPEGSRQAGPTTSEHQDDDRPGQTNAGRPGHRRRAPGAGPSPAAPAPDDLNRTPEDAVRLLVGEGVSQRKARLLAAAHPLGEIVQQIGWLDGRRYDDRAACLVAAIEGSYGAPVASRSPSSPSHRGGARIAPHDQAGRDVAYTGGAYGVCPACLSSPCDPDCPLGHR